jgi:hypothetical protein
MKAAASQTNKGGGVAGKADRLGGAAGHAKFKCPICAQQAPDMKTMQVRRRPLRGGWAARARRARAASLVVGVLFYQQLLYHQHLFISAGSAAEQGRAVVRHAVMSQALTRRCPDRERGACCADTP